MVHKSGHHFDLVNWWVNSSPKQVVGMGKTAFYGKKNGAESGWAKVGLLYLNIPGTRLTTIVGS